MNLKKLLTFLVMFLAIVSFSRAQQPYGGCWHPDYIKGWTPEKDPDAKFNRSKVPLKPRFKDATIKANQYQFYDGKVTACLTMNPMCSQTPSQGANNFIGYNPTYWQYMDILVWWGGSAGEGIITPPSAPVTDIAHMNGVKVLGNIFFPPTAFGGQVAWVTQMLTKESDGSYPYAKKLYDIAKYYGFDGWFINSESGGASASDWAAFVAYFDKCAVADGNTQMELQYYDMGTSASSVINILKVHGASFFANYGSASSSTISSNKSACAGAGISADDFFSKVYHGIECAQGGIGGNAGGFQACFPATGHAGSIDLFNPEEGIWKQVVKNALGTNDASGAKAYDLMKTVFSNEARFWVNLANDPSNTTARSSSSSWPGFANALMERSTIQEKPFVTSFSTGLGKYRFVNGEKKAAQDWYHRGMQSIMPTWRWWIESTVANEISVNLNWDDAYNMGTSLLVKGKLSAGVDHLTRLYKTKIVASAGDKLQLVYKTNTANSMEVKLAVSEDANAFVTFPVTETSTNNGWSIATIDLSSLAGKTISVIALNFKSSSEVADYQSTLGQLSVVGGSYKPAAETVSNLTAQNELTQTVSDIRLTWDAPASSEIDHYNVYFEKNGVKSLVGQTRDEGYYIPKFNRISSSETFVKAYVTAVTKDMNEGSEVALQLNYPTINVPAVQLKAMKTLVKVGEEVAVVARATNFPEKYTWTVPNNAQLIRQSQDTAFFKFNAAGKYNIKVNVANSVGSTDELIESLVDVSDSKSLQIVSVGKTIKSYSGALSPEVPSNIIDGVEVPSDVHGKWCIGGAKSHWVIIDLKEMFNIYRFRIFDCGNKENYSDNFQNFKIELSNDGENWNEVLNEKNRPENTKDDYIKPTVARYVRFTPYSDELAITIRVWEFEVFGIQGNISLASPSMQTVNINSTSSMKVAYGLGGDPKDANFKFAVTSSDPNVVAISNVTNDEENLTFDLSGKTTGKAEVTVSFTNGIWTKENKFVTRVVDPENMNVLSGIIPTISTGTSFLEKNNETATTGAIGAKGITDDNEGTWWSGAYKSGGTTNTLTFSLGASYKISSLRSLFYKHSYFAIPSKMIVYASTTTDEESQYEEVANFSSNITEDMDIVPSSAFYAKYIKFVFNTTSYYSVSLKELSAMGKKEESPAPTTKKVFTPVSVSGFDADVIAENLPSAQYTTDKLDDQGWDFYSAAVKATGSLPIDGKVMTSKGVNYQFAPYSGNNTVMLKESTSVKTLTTAPFAAQAIYLLGTSANGASTVKAILTYSDGTESSALEVSFSDWYGDASGTAVSGLDRIIRAAASGYTADQFDGRSSFRMFEGRVAADPAKEITGIKIQRSSSSGYPIIFAVSKETIENINTGISNPTSQSLKVYPNPVRNGQILSVESTDAESVQLVSLQGSVLYQQNITSSITEIPVNNLAPGIYLVMVKSSNGVSTSKVLIK